MRTTQEPIEQLTQRQMEMEDHALALGGMRFRRKLEEAMASGSEAQVGAARKLLTEGLVKVEDAMRELLLTKGRGRRHMATRWVEKLGVDAAAYLSLKVVLDNIHGRVSVRRASLDVTELVIDELRFRRFKEKEPQLFEYAMTGFSTSSYAYRARSLDGRINRNEVDVSDLSMTMGERYTVGVKLLDIVVAVTGLVEIQHKKTRENGKNVEMVELVGTEETLKWLSTRNDALEFLWPVNLPMVMPPLPWADKGRKGGYRFALRGKHKLVRSNSQSPRTNVEQASIPAVYSALNRIQETPWRVNLKVLETVQALIDQGGDIAGLPPTSEESIPPKPHDIETNEEAKIKWKKAATAMHDKNHESRILRSELFRILSIANKVKDEGAIWFPHNLDFRGRVYPVVNYLHPQGDDMCKGLLQFAEGKPLGRDGAGYLALHGAAALGKTHAGLKLSHMTLQERVDYVVSISTDICQVAQDPLQNAWWMEADDRWQFLAFCFEWAGYCAYDIEGRPHQFVSSLPVTQDGTCNGLQHFAALWLDPVGGKAVNVVPSDRPQDIYQAIADVVTERLAAAASTTPYALVWIESGLIDRKLTKRPTMTFGYGSQQFGFSSQIREYVEALPDYRSKYKAMFTGPSKNKEGEDIRKSFLPQACTYLAGLIWEALEVVAVSAFQGMAWFRACAKTVSKDAGKCVEWVVPGTGFPVRQAYLAQSIRRNVSTVLAGKVYLPRMYMDTLTPAWKKQTSSIAPNIIHSLDASALMMTVNASADAGVSHFAMVHDSYGTLAADAPILATATRQAFHSLYANNDVVNSLWGQFAAQVDGTPDAEVPMPPQKGGSDGTILDLTGVLLSDYFFS